MARRHVIGVLSGMGAHVVPPVASLKRTVPIACPARVWTVGFCDLLGTPYAPVLIYWHFISIFDGNLFSPRWCENQIDLFVTRKSHIQHWKIDSTPWIVTLQLFSLFNKVLLIKHNVYTTRKNLIKKWMIMNMYLNLKELLSYLTKMFKCFCPYQSCYNFDPRGLHNFLQKGKISTQKH